MGNRMKKNNRSVLTVITALMVLFAYADFSFAFHVNRGVKKYHDSCNNGVGNIDDCSLLGSLYYEGAKVRQNYEQAFKFSKMACDKDAASGCYILGQLYSFDRFVESNKTIAFEYFSLACNKGNHGAACLELARNHRRNGDIGKAVSYTEKACGGGNAKGCTMAGGHYYSAIKKSKNTKRDFVKSFRLYGKACDLDDIVGCMSYARMFVYGLGVEASEESAKKYYGKACDLEVKFWKMRRSACEEYDGLEQRLERLRKSYYKGKNITSNSQRY